MRYYKLKQDRLTQDHIDIKSFPSNWNRSAILTSKFQFLDKSLEYVEVSDSSGVEYPDLIEQDGYILFSDRLKSIFDLKANSMIYYKPIKVLDYLLDKSELYWLAVVDRIPCVNMELSEYDNDLSFPVFKKIVFDYDKIGNYNLFRIEEEGCFSIFISSELKNILEKENLIGLEYIAV